jgi:MoxR-like ATPase
MDEINEKEPLENSELDLQDNEETEKKSTDNIKESSFVQEKGKEVIAEISKIVLGQYDFIEKVVVALFSGGHVLIEGVPGLAKTLTARVLSKVLDLDCKRVQFTPDLMPSDITGIKIYDSTKNEFTLKKGPVFTNILIADEINRTPPKTQSALLQSMEEHIITIDGENHSLGSEFFVLATQNPLEYEGTYPLPEAQLDRFMMKLILDYPPQKFENDILKNVNEGFDSQKLDDMSIKVVCSVKELQRCKEEIKKVHVNQEVINYITSITKETRKSPALVLGASPRASVALLSVAKTFAAINGRNFVVPEDVKELAPFILRHRIILKPDISLEGINVDKVISGILKKVEVPR